MNKTFLCLAVTGLAMCASAQSDDDDATGMPQMPALNASQSDWDAYLLSLNVYLRVNGPLLTNTNDSYTLHGDWSVQQIDGSDSKASVQNAGGSPALEFANRVWQNSGGTSPTQCEGNAYAYERWNCSASFTQNCAGYYEYKFSYWGGPWHKGEVQNIEAWYEWVGFARAYNSDCGAFAASVGRYADGIGADLTWANSVAAEAGSNVLPASVGLLPAGGGPTVNVTLTTSSNGVAMDYNIAHRAPASKVVVGTPGNPGIVLVQKEMHIATHAQLYSFTGWAGPAQAGAFHDCSFQGTFTEV